MSEEQEAPSPREPEDLSGWPAEYEPSQAQAFRFLVARFAEAGSLRAKGTKSSLVGSTGRKLKRVGTDEELLRRAQRLDIEGVQALQAIVLECVAGAFLALQRGEAAISDQDGTARLLRVVKPTVPGALEDLMRHYNAAEAGAGVGGYELVPDDELERMREAKREAAALVPEARMITDDLPTTEGG